VDTYDDAQVSHVPCRSADDTSRDHGCMSHKDSLRCTSMAIVQLVTQLYCVVYTPLHDMCLMYVHY